MDILISQEELSAILENIINFTNLVDTATFLIKKYREFYEYREEVVDELGKDRVDINIDVEHIYISNNQDMLKFVFENADILMRPYVLKLYRPGSDRLRRITTIQKTLEQNQEIINKLKKKTKKKGRKWFCI